MPAAWNSGVSPGQVPPPTGGPPLVTAPPPRALSGWGGLPPAPDPSPAPVRPPCEAAVGPSRVVQPAFPSTLQTPQELPDDAAKAGLRPPGPLPGQEGAKVQARPASKSESPRQRLMPGGFWRWSGGQVRLASLLGPEPARSVAGRVPWTRAACAGLVPPGARWGHCDPACSGSSGRPPRVPAPAGARPRQPRACAVSCVWSRRGSQPDHLPPASLPGWDAAPERSCSAWRGAGGCTRRLWRLHGRLAVRVGAVPGGSQEGLHGSLMVTSFMVF